MQIDVDSIIGVLYQILGTPPAGLEFLYVVLAGLLLIFVFHLLEHIFELLFGKFFNR